MSETRFFFASFQLDVANQQLRKDGQVLALRPKPFAMLQHLVTHHGRLVSKAELLRTAWPDVVVGEGVLKSYIRDLRLVLGDRAAKPQFIETVERRGYRFIAPVTVDALEVGKQDGNRNLRPEGSLWTQQDALVNRALSMLVGRDPELTQLRQWWAKTATRQRQVVFVTGEAGIGKTTLIEAFLASAGEIGPLWVGRGQCVEHYGAGEPYLPVLEALGRLCRQPGGERLIAILRQQAPTWLLQLPAFVADTELEGLHQRVHGTTHERMLREMVEVLETVTTERSLVLILEDLQWSDVSTLDLISRVAQRYEPTRLLLIGSYRPVDMLTYPALKSIAQELYVRRQGEELPLHFLTPTHVFAYLTVRFPHHRFPFALAQVVHQHTEGNPLFMVTVIDDLLEQGALQNVDGAWALTTPVQEVRVSVPESLRHMLEKQFERLSENEQRVLEVASIAGSEFSTAVVAAVLQDENIPVEECCEGLARRKQFVQSVGLDPLTFASAGRYRFQHTLYQSTLASRVGAARQVLLHQRLGEHLEQRYGPQVRHLAVELAMHFEHGRDYQRAVQYLWQATETARQRCAHREAVAHLMHMRELLGRLSPTSERIQEELALLTVLGAQLTVTKGYGSPEVEKAYAEAWELCKQVEEDFRLFPILAGLSRFYVMRAELEPARALADQLLKLAHTLQDPTLLMAGHCQLGGVLFWRGEFAAAQDHLEQSSALYDPQLHQALTSLYAEDPGVVCRVFLALNLWLRGYPDRAVEQMLHIVQLTRDMGDLYGQTFALFFTASLHQYRKDWQSAQDYASAIMTLARAEGFLLWEAGATAMQGWAFSEQGRYEEGIVLLRQGLSGWRATGAKVGQPYIHGLLAEALGQAGRPHEGLAVLEEQFGAELHVGPCECAAELHRVKGELLLRMARSAPQANCEQPKLHFHQHAAESCFHTAITIAHRQGAKSWELRAVTSLCRLWRQQGKIEEARQALTDVYSWFTEGNDTGDLKEAKALLDALV